MNSKKTTFGDGRDMETISNSNKTDTVKTLEKCIKDLEIKKKDK